MPTFAAFEDRLIRFVVNRIQNGDCSERLLARLIGISQPHLHHVLKRTRSLRKDLADALLRHFEITLPDLLSKEELEAHLEGRPITRRARTLQEIAPHVHPKRFHQIEAVALSRKPPRKAAQHHSCEDLREAG